MSWIKSKLLIILTVITGISVLFGRHWYHQSTRAKAKVAQGEAKAVAQEEFHKIEKLQTEVKSAEDNRKRLVAKFRSNGKRGSKDPS